MRISVSAPGLDVTAGDHETIERDLEKLSRRLQQYDDAAVRVRLSNGKPKGCHSVLELDYGRTHLVASCDGADIGQAVRGAREELLRQINDRTRRGHSSIAKGS